MKENLSIYDEIKNMKGIRFTVNDKIQVSLQNKKFGVKLSKLFSINKYGLEKAFELAKEARKEFENNIEELKKKNDVVYDSKYYLKPINSILSDVDKYEADDILNDKVLGVYKYSVYYIARMKLKNNQFLETAFSSRILGKKKALAFAIVERKRMESFNKLALYKNEKFKSITEFANKYIQGNYLILNNDVKLKLKHLENHKMVLEDNENIEVELISNNIKYPDYNLYIIDNENNNFYLCLRNINGLYNIKFDMKYIEKVKEKTWKLYKEIGGKRDTKLKIKTKNRYNKTNLFEYVFDGNLINYICYDLNNDFIDLTKEGILKYLNDVLFTSNRYVYTHNKYSNNYEFRIPKLNNSELNVLRIDNDKEKIVNIRNEFMMNEFNKIKIYC